MVYATRNQALPYETSFAYLDIPFTPKGYLDPYELIKHSSSKASATMSVLMSIDINPSGFSRLLLTKFYNIQPIALGDMLKIRIPVRSAMPSERSSTKVMLYLAKLSLMTDQAHILHNASINFYICLTTTYCYVDPYLTFDTAVDPSGTSFPRFLSGKACPLQMKH